MPTPPRRDERISRKTYHLPHELQQWVAEEAERTGVTESQVVAVALDAARARSAKS
jgi:hypothetical protein